STHCSVPFRCPTNRRAALAQYSAFGALPARTLTRTDIREAQSPWAGTQPVREKAGSPPRRIQGTAPTRWNGSACRAGREEESPEEKKSLRNHALSPCETLRVQKSTPFAPRESVLRLSSREVGSARNDRLCAARNSGARGTPGHPGYLVPTCKNPSAQCGSSSDDSLPGGSLRFGEIAEARGQWSGQASMRTPSSNPAAWYRLKQARRN